jgi:hypothetical protein
VSETRASRDSKPSGGKLRKQEKKVRKPLQPEACTLIVDQSCRDLRRRKRRRRRKLHSPYHLVRADRRSIRRLSSGRGPEPCSQVESKVGDKEKKLKEKKEKLAKAQAGYNKVMSPHPRDLEKGVWC